MTSFRRIATMAIATAAAHVTAAYIFRARRRRYAGDRRHILVVQGGVDIRPTADEIADAVISVMMGGVLLDLRHAPVNEGPAHLDLFVVMGGVMLVVPEDWNVRLEVETTMGGIRDGRPAMPERALPVDLVVSGRVMMGGVEVSSRLPGTRQQLDTSEVGSPRSKELAAGRLQPEPRRSEAEAEASDAVDNPGEKTRRRKSKRGALSPSPDPQQS